MRSDGDLPKARKRLEDTATVTNVRLCQAVSFLAGLAFFVGLWWLLGEELGGPEDMRTAVALTVCGQSFATMFGSLAIVLGLSRHFLLTVKRLEESNKELARRLGEANGQPANPSTERT